MLEEQSKAQDLAKEGKYEEAIELFNIAIKKGSTSAISDLGVVYEKMKDYEKSIKCYEKASILGVGTATYNLGLDYQEGRGVDVDLDYASKLFYRAIKQGCCHANYKIASDIYDLKDEKNYKKAFNLVKEGIELDSDYLHNGCMWLLGIFYEHGIGTKINKKKALKCFLECAHSGDEYAMYKAAFILSQKKCITRKEINLMLNLLDEATNKEHEDAPVLMACIYDEGKLVKRDREKALHYLFIGIDRDSWYAWLTYIDFCLSGNYIDIKLDKEHAYNVLLCFLVECNNIEDYSDSYNYLKNKYKNSLDWEKLEKKAKAFIDV